MTNNPTIDGVPCKTIERAIDAIEQVGYQDKFIDYTFVGEVKQELRDMLDAPEVERQEPFAYYFKFAGYVTTEGPQGWRTEIELEKPAQFLFDDGRVKDFTPLYKESPEVAALQSTIAQLQARVQELESGRGEPVAYADPIAFENFKNHAHKGGHWDHEWMWAKPDSRMVPLFTAPPAPVAVVPDGWKLVPVEPTDDMIVAFAEAWYSKRQTIDDPDMLDAYRDMLASAPVCLDATAALNTVHVGELDPAQRLALARGESFVCDISGNWNTGWTFIDANKTGEGQGVCYAFPPGLTITGKWV